MLYQIFEKVIKLEQQGKKIIKFNVGDPDQKTPAEIISAAFQAMRAGKTKYSSSAGEKSLRTKIAKIYKVKPENVIVTPGSKFAIFSLMAILLRKGENVILPTPHWPEYELIIKKIGVAAKFLKCELENNWEINIDDLKNLIDGKTKMIILNNPNNPTSKVIEENTVGEIVNLANKKGITILSDEAYSDISFKKIKNILDFDGSHIFINSFSKLFAMTGWRLGFAIVSESLAKKMIELNQATISCVPPFIQTAAIKALEMRETISDKMRKIYKKRADLACDILAKTKLKFARPDAPFYLFVRCFEDSEKLALRLLDKGIAITPGSAFGDFKDYFRISLTLPEKELKEGLEKIASYFPPLNTKNLTKII